MSPEYHCESYGYWGKAGHGAGSEFHPIVYHSLDVAAVGFEYWRQDKVLQDSFTRLSGLSPGSLSAFLPWLLALHDIGKFGDGFQSLRPDVCDALDRPSSGNSNTPRHDTLGYLWLCREIGRGGIVDPARCSEDLQDRTDLLDCIQPWLKAVCGHHGMPPDPGAWNSVRDGQKFEKAESAILEYLEILETELAFGPADAFAGTYDEVLSAGTRSSWLLAGFAVLCDWLGSDTTYFPYVQERMPLAEYWETRALPQACQAIQESRLLCARPETERSFAELFPGFLPSGGQSLVAGLELPTGPSLHLIEAPTGTGKTESALCLAHRLIVSGAARGIYFALPTQATANAMEGRVRSVARDLVQGVEANDVVLAHSARAVTHALRRSASVPAEYEKDETSASGYQRRWFADGIKKALLAPIGVGTIDQALLAVLPIRHQSLRLFGLAGKVLIVDEVHASDHYVHRLLCVLLEHVAAIGGSAILLSATLPKNMRNDLVSAFAKGGGELASTVVEECDYPLLTAWGSLGARCLRLPSEPGTSRSLGLEYVSEESQVVTAIVKAARAGECACWIRNTIDDCLEGANQLMDRLGVDNVDVFHARFPLGRRLEIEAAVLDRFGPSSEPAARRGRVLVATQVVEQSLDLDFDFLASDLAPLDLLIQRAGRLRRHRRDEAGRRISGRDERGAPVLVVFGPAWNSEPDEDWFAKDFPRACFVYKHVGELWRTARLLNLNSTLQLPEQCQGWMSAVFDDDAEPALPRGLDSAELAALASGFGQGALASQNGLVLRNGYTSSLVSWRDEGDTPTRLGRESVTVRFAHQVQGHWGPLLGEGQLGWFLSECRLTRNLIAEEDDGVCTELIDEIKATMDDEGKHRVLVLMVRDSLGNWNGTARAQPWPDGPLLACAIHYSATEGLRIRREDQNE